MTRQDAIKLFEPFFNKMDKTPELRDFGKWLFNKLPDYWFTKPASSSGKYHPSFANGDGGLVRHTLAVCHYWDLFHRGFIKDLETELHTELASGQLVSYSYEMGLFSVIFHDALKYGDHDAGLTHTIKDHDHESAIWVNTEVANFTDETGINISGYMIDEICWAIEHHMGPWSTNGPPETLFQRLVFLADYAASAKIVEAEVFYDIKRTN